MTEFELEKTYDPHAIEQTLYDDWERSGYFGPSGSGSSYCIMIPPPNVTGSLHMGHAFQDTIMDALIRYHRMRGDRTLWQAGSDHAGIATQMVVERQLEAQGSSRHDLGRDAFVDKVWEWRETSGGTITQQLRRMGASLDWSRERFTMDEGLSEAVQEVFIRLYDEGLIYRGKRLVNWDPVLHTALSDLEVISQEERGHLWHLRYPIADGSGHLVVATTRPETMLGDTAVAVHPEDDRYQHLIGRSVMLPLVEREIPIIADDYVDPEFGSGCVKITPAHDFNDYEIGIRHQLPLINVLSVDAAIDLPDTPYHGLDRYDARKRVLEDLEAKDLIDEIQDHTLMVPRGDRSHTVVEPYLTDQWYVEVKPLADPAIEAVKSGRIRFVPDNWSRTYYEWMNNIEDWCISRQIWWGHRIPAWYDESGNIFVARNAHDANAQALEMHGREVPLRQDEDVLDTWFSSALWPFSTLGWPANTSEFSDHYPTSVLVTGFDIIFFWVARMIMFGLKFTDDVPFAEVYVHGLVRDAEGNKMSKSKGNVLDPLDLIDGINLDDLVEKRTAGLMQPEMAKRIENDTRKHFPDGIPSYGTDALRFTFASLATQGRDIRFDLGRIEGHRNFCNKLWNAARFVLMNTQSLEGVDTDRGENGITERWIRSRLDEATDSVTRSIEEYRFDHMTQAIHTFVWDEYCSWYLEIAKILLGDDRISDERKIAVRKTLVSVLEAALRLLHPTMPFITEEIWRKISPLAGVEGPSIMVQPFPTASATTRDDEATREVDWIKSVVSGVRNIRGEMNLDPRRRLPVLIEGGTDDDLALIDQHRDLISELARLESIVKLEGDDAPESATSLIGHMKVLVPLDSVVDRDAELQRLQKEIDRITKDLDRCRSKLDNASFVERAPKEVVDKERQRATELESALSEIRGKFDRFEKLGSA